MIGRLLAQYRVTASLGSGGMGEVWLARDTRLGREVALKVLPADFAENPDRLARFEREARVLASLNHPGIATLYGLEHVEGRHVLVMELVEGEGLDERIARGPVPAGDVVALARQIADALEAAHEKGIVHRDLKPGNVRLRPDGTVKVLDFGLAKEWEGDESEPNVSTSPTKTRHATAAGVILGTAAYMAPEQARGKPVDRRADVWAFGVLLWEMVTGRRLFAGETMTDVLAAVLTHEPDWRAVEEAAGPEFAGVVRGCLEREPRRRFGSAADVALLLERALRALSAPAGAGAPAARGGGRKLAAALLAAGLLGGLAIGAGLARRAWTGPATARVERLSVVEPDVVAPSGVAISPDGRLLAFTVERDQGSILAVRPLDRFDAVVLPGTEGAMCPFFSPDGAWLGYFTRNEIRKVPVAGGPPRTLATLGGSVRFDPWNSASYPTADWSADDTIVFSSGFWREPAALPGLFTVPGSGGTPRPVTSLDGKELGHRSPRFTPDGRHIVFTALGSGPRNTHVDVVLRESGRRWRLQADAVLGRVLPSGHLVYLDGFYSRLVAAAIDPATLRLEGPAVPLIEGISTAASESYAVSTGGTLVYVAAGAGEGQKRLVRVGLDGSVASLVDRAGSWYQPRTAPDGKSLVVREVGEECRLWLYDFARRTLTPLTSSGDNHQPVWMRNGREVVYGREDAASGGRALFRQAADGSGPPVMLLPGASASGPASGAVPYPDSFSPGDRALLFERSTLATGSDLWVAPMDGGSPEPFLATPAFEGDGAFSPDGRWVAYVSDESGREEVYVRAYPGKGGRTRVSVAGGEWPLWSRDGSRLYFNQGRRLMGVDFAGDGPEATVGRPKELLAGFAFGRGNVDVLPDGESFVLVEPAARGLVEIRVVRGWTRELADLVPRTAVR